MLKAVPMATMAVAMSLPASIAPQAIARHQGSTPVGIAPGVDTNAGGTSATMVEAGTFSSLTDPAMVWQTSKRHAQWLKQVDLGDHLT